MFAIIQTGGKQYRVQEGDTIRIEKLELEPGDAVQFSALLVGGEHTLAGAAAADIKVSGEVVTQGKWRKIYINKYKSGIQYRKRTGHRQQFTAVKITGIK